MAQLSRISKASRKLLGLLSIKDLHEAPDGPCDPDITDALELAPIDLDPGHESARIARLVEICEAAEAAWKIERLAVSAWDQEGDFGKARGMKGHHGDKPENDWIADVMEIYGKLKPSFRGGEGSIVRFLKAAGKPLSINHTADSWHSRIAAVRRQRKKDQK